MVTVANQPAMCSSRLARAASASLCEGEAGSRPRPWCHGEQPHDPLEGGAEGAFGFVAERPGNDGNGIAGILQPVPGPAACASGTGPAVHRLDAAHLYRLVLEKGSAGGRYHGVADEGVPFRDIAGVIGRRLKVPVVSKAPEEAAKHFGWFAPFATIDSPASSQRTRELLGWQTKQLGLIPDLDRPRYFQA